MKYAKQPIALSQQLKLLEQRGLIIQNEETALSQLQSISYFRLASYWHSMEVPNSDKHRFLPDSNFDDVIELYQFDKKLRTLVFASIQDIEIALRTRIIQWFSLKYGAFWFMDVRLFKDEGIFANCLENIQKEVNRSNEDFLKEHFKKYNDPSLPPVWKTMEVISFGTLSKLYCNFNDTGVKKQVAKKLWFTTVSIFGKLDEMRICFTKLLCSPRTTLEPPFSYYASAPKKLASSMDWYKMHTTNQTIWSSLLFGIFGTKY